MIHPSHNTGVLVRSSTPTGGGYESSSPLRKFMPCDGSDASNQITRFITQSAVEALLKLRGYETDWDGNGSAKPMVEAIANAEARLPELYRIACNLPFWRNPDVSASESGEISFEWWGDSRKVTMYFGATTMEVIKVWGVDIDTQMDHFPLNVVDEFASVWIWLYGR